MQKQKKEKKLKKRIFPIEKIFFVIISLFFIYLFLNLPEPQTTDIISNTSLNSSQDLNQTISFPKEKILVGWRSSIYNYQQDMSPSYWVNFANDMSSRIPNSIPSGIWIIGGVEDGKCYLTFPSSENYPYIKFSSVDGNEEYLDEFDKYDIKIWLQVEPGYADVETLIDLVLTQYKHHPSVIGFGIDVEWYKNGRSVTNNEAQRWLTKVKSYNSEYKLFLKHWKISKMPSEYPDDIVFINDGQEVDSLDNLVKVFKEWGDYFSDAEVGFQIGYPSDKRWWKKLDDPQKEIANVLIGNISNTKGVYWVDFR